MFIGLMAVKGIERGIKILIPKDSHLGPSISQRKSLNVGLKGRQRHPDQPQLRHRA
jgi:hypothetical protein